MKNAATALTIRTNRHWRNILDRSDVPAAVLASEFDWLDEDDQENYQTGFLCYKGTWYHLSQFLSGDHGEWQGSHGESYFSAILIRLSRDGEQYMIARCYC